MSTYLYLVCEDHDPRLFSAEEVSQHTETEIERVRGWVKDRKKIVRVEDGELMMTGEYMLDNAIRFLKSHMDCRLTAQDEYGEKYTVMPEPPAPTRIHRSRGGW